MKRSFSYLLSVFAVLSVGCRPDPVTDPAQNVNLEEAHINGVWWAARNVNAPGEFADHPEEMGMFYQWGKNVGWSATGAPVSSTGSETWDGSVVLEGVWDAEQDPCPEGWHVPSIDDFNALGDAGKVSRKWTVRGGMDGQLFSDRATGETIFMPAAGFRVHTDGTLGKDPQGEEIQGKYGFYWSSTTDGGASGSYMYFYSNMVYPDNDNFQAFGRSVRCVRE
jgi:uncharacterized protein (TIGR02145 family)